MTSIELQEYRWKLLNRLEAAADDFAAACRAVVDPFTTRHDGWTVHQLAAHTRDVAVDVYGPRVRRTATEDNPEFKNFDADAWMAAHYNPAEPLDAILNELTENIHSLVAFLRQLPEEAWARQSRHEINGGGFTLQLWVERNLAHIEEHRQSVRSAK
ncbi:MAG: DinB family protein [Anaerolineae bacterium]